MEELWDIARVAAYLGVSERTVYNKVRAGDLPAVKVGRLWRVRPSQLDAWLATGLEYRGRHRLRVAEPGAIPDEELSLSRCSRRWPRRSSAGWRSSGC